MDNVFKAVRLSDHVYWVGAVDWSIRDFHGYSTNRGTTYNAFLIKGEKVALIDTVKEPFMDEMISRIASVVSPQEIDYIISNHGELDHSGCLPEVVDAVKPEKVLASPKGLKCLEQHFHIEHEVTPVKSGETLSLGDINLKFMETPMLHWPESMFTMLVEEGILFSQDAFGMHLATSAIFADEIEEPVLEYEASKYFANILMPYAPRIKKLLDKGAELFHDVTMIAPDHGPIWRIHPKVIIDYYYRWTAQEPTKRGVVIYDTMWQSTEKMARAVGEGLMHEQVAFQLLPLRNTHRSDIVTEVMKSGAFVVGAPTLNNNMFPTVADILYYLKGLRPANKVAGAFGSYGWSAESVKQIQQMLTEMKVDVVGEGVKCNYRPDGDVLSQCYQLGSQVGQRLIENMEKTEIH
jgi:flavorubredoxin